MNIFILDKNITKCARYHCDKHVVKMILESAQILCTVCNKHGIRTPYRSTHAKHPCVLWAEASIQNWRWLRRLAQVLNEEFKYRYCHQENHRSYQVIQKLREPKLPSLGLTDHPQAMPAQYRVPSNPVLAYRSYYNGMKRPIAAWTRRREPQWFKLSGSER